MFEQMLPEIIAEVFSLLSVQDCRNVMHALNTWKYTAVDRRRELVEARRRWDVVYEKFNCGYIDRTSVVKYIGKHFPNLEQLFDSMVCNNVIISGSRAISFFMPGCIEQDSDWDFYIAEDTEKVASFMDFMTTIGVEWETTVKEFKDTNYPSVLDISVTEGILLYRARTTKVQLIVCGSKSTPLDIVRSFTASIAQCFISPYMACHMYSYDLYSRKSTVWNTWYNETSKEYITKWIKKYKKRGFEFYYRSTHSRMYPDIQKRVIKRTIGDPNTDVINIEDMTYSEISDEHKKLGIQELYSYSWLEHSSGLEPDNLSYDYSEKRYLQACLRMYSILVDIPIQKELLAKNKERIKNELIEPLLGNLSEI